MKRSEQRLAEFKAWLDGVLIEPETLTVRHAPSYTFDLRISWVELEQLQSYPVIQIHSFEKPIFAGDPYYVILSWKKVPKPLNIKFVVPRCCMTCGMHRYEHGWWFCLRDPKVGGDAGDGEDLYQVCSRWSE